MKDDAVMMKRGGRTEEGRNEECASESLVQLLVQPIYLFTH